MTNFNVGRASVSELVQRFEAIALAQDNALLGLHTSTYNRLYKDMESIRQELRSRLGDQRQALSPLLESTNTQVKMKAAISLLTILPDQARQILEDIRADRFTPQSLDAGWILRGLEDGSYVPE